MPYLFKDEKGGLHVRKGVRQATDMYVSKGDLHKMSKPSYSWNPEANGKVIRHDDGRLYEITPQGWRRRKDLEALETMKQNVATHKENDNGTENRTAAGSISIREVGGESESAAK